MTPSPPSFSLPPSPSPFSLPSQPFLAPSAPLPPPPSSDIKRPKDLEILEPFLKSLLQNYVYNDVSIEKTQQILMLRKVDQYWRGNHYLYPDINAYSHIEYRPIQGQTLYPTQDQDRQRGLFDISVNLILGDGLKFVAVIGPRSPNAHARPDDPNDDEACAKARKVDTLLAKLKSWWDVDDITQNAAMNFWREGGAFVHTPAVSDSDKYGHFTIPKYVDSVETLRPAGVECPLCQTFTPSTTLSQCPTCSSPLTPLDVVPPLEVSVPQPAGEETLPRTGVDARLESFLTTNSPFNARCLDEMPWFWYERDVHKAELVRTFPFLIQKIRKEGKGGMATSANIMQQQRFAREAQTTLSGSYAPFKTSNWSYAKFWLSTSMFYLFYEDEIDDPDAPTPDAPKIPLTDYLLTRYPRGLRMEWVDDELVRLAPERLSHVWAYTKAGVGPTFYTPPVCWPYLPIQDQVNDITNLFIETIVRNIPYMLADPTVINPDAFTNRPPVPGELVFCLPGMGQKLNDAIKNSPTAKIEPLIGQWVDSLIGKAREIVGILPSIFGGDTGVEKTARQSELDRNQALQQLNLYWQNLRKLFKSAWLNGIRQLVYNTIDDPDPINDTLFDPNGNPIGWHIEVEEAIPMSWGAYRDFFMYLMDKGPQAWDLTGLTHPANLPRMYDALGMTGWQLRGQNARNAILEEVRALLNSQPQMALDPMTGAPTPQPSIPPNLVLYDPAMVVDVVRDWLLSDDGRKYAKNPQTQAGYQNVVAYVQAYLLVLQQQQMAQAQAQAQAQSASEEGKPGGGPPPSPSGPPPPPPNTQPPLPPEEQNTPQILG